MEASPAAEPAIDGAMVPVVHRVVDKRQDTHDTWTIRLAPVDKALPQFDPGQFAMLYAFGVGEVPISASDCRHDSGTLLHTVREVGEVTRALCALSPGATVGVRGPFGTPWPVREAEGGDVVVVAGGIGLAPLRPVIHYVLANRERFGHVGIAYGGRSSRELLYLEELEHWRGRFDVELDVTVDSAAGEWRGRVGVVTTLIPPPEIDPANTMAFVCGPEVMMRFTVAALRDAGVARGRVMLSMERSMKCAIGHCGHCQLREFFICKDGPVFRGDVIEPLMLVREQ